MIVLFLGYFIADIPKIQGEETKTNTAELAQTLKSTHSLNHLDLLSRLLFSISSRDEAQNILNQIAKSRDTRFVAGLIDILRYHRALTQEIGRTLNQLTGQKLLPDWGDWVEWAGKHPEIKSFNEYSTWKASIFEKIDPNFRRFVRADMKIAPGSRVEEIVWGGVRDIVNSCV